MFVCICLAGWILAVAVIPPKAQRYWSLAQLEAQLKSRRATLKKRVELLKGAIYSIETDPFYREAVYRSVLGVKKKSEEFLKSRRDSTR